MENSQIFTGGDGDHVLGSLFPDPSWCNFLKAVATLHKSSLLKLQGIIIALVTVCERMGDIFLSWLPMYGEVKLAFFIYLWHPKTKGTGYIYDTLLRPLVARHETGIERKLQEMRARGWDFAMYYWDICTELGQTKFFEVLQYLASQSGKFTNNNSEKSDGDEPSATSPNELPSLAKNTSRNSNSPPRPPTPPGSSTINREVAGSPKSKRVQVHLNEETESVIAMDTDNSTNLDPNVNEKLHQFHSNGMEDPIKSTCYARNNMTTKEPKTCSDGILGGEPKPEASEEVARRISRGGHGLEVSPGSMFDKAVANGNFIRGCGGGIRRSRRVNGGRRQKVFKRSVG
ncbi:hypothetical protein D5086_013485 [Populus alba]|uniref:Uncharacterized protein n=1 Tax=Populus alba TaxID=43335 RepID=A0ACC4C5S1_POPAL